MTNHEAIVLENNAELARRILDEVARVRGMYGYTSVDETGYDAGVWLGAPLHAMESYAQAIFNNCYAVANAK